MLHTKRINIFNFLATETEAGSAEEQPARDRLSALSRKGPRSPSLVAFFYGYSPMPKKTYYRKRACPTHFYQWTRCHKYLFRWISYYPHIVLSRPKAARKTLRLHLLSWSLSGKLYGYRTLAISYLFLSRSTKNTLLTSFLAMRMMALLGFKPRLI